MAHGLVQYIAISKKVKNSALRYFYLNAEKNTSLGAAGYVRTRQIVNLCHNLDFCSGELLQYFNTSNDFLKQL